MPFLIHLRLRFHQPKQLLRVCLGALCLFVLIACGGGGKGADPDPGLAVSASSINFAASGGDPAPERKLIHITITSQAAAYVGAAWIGTAPSWVDATSLTGGGTQWDLGLQITTTLMAPGTYTATLRIGVAKSDQSVIGTRDVVITYTVGYGFKGSPASLAFTAEYGQTPSSGQDLTIVGSPATWTASADQGWISLEKTSGAVPSLLNVKTNPSGLALGTYTGKITVQSNTPSGSTSFQIPVTLAVVAPGLQTGVDGGGLVFSGVNGSVIASQPIALSLSNGATMGWSATTSASWLVLSRTDGTTLGPVQVSVDPSMGPLASGTYHGTIIFQGTYEGIQLTKTVPVTLNLSKPALSFTASELVLGGANGRTLSAQPVQLSLNTGAVLHPWTVTPSVSWLAPVEGSGMVSTTPYSLGVAVNPASMSAGTHTGSLAFSVTVNGDTVTASLPVTLNLDTHRLLASDTGVALTSMPTLAKLTRTLQVRDNLGLATPWAATSDQPWLAVTPSGTAGGDLVLTANPLGLTADTIHYGTITLNSTDSSVATTESIRVGFWVGSTDSAASTVISTPFTRLVVDPIRPYAYVHKAGSDLTIYHLFTCEVVGTIQAVAAQLGDMTISNDGTTLYATDATNFRIVPVNLDNREVGTPWGIGVPVAPYIQYTRTNGKGLIVTGNRGIFDSNTGSLLGGDLRPDFNFPVATSLNGDHFSIELMIHSLDHTSLGGGKALIGSMQLPDVVAWNSRDYAFSNDGTRFYMAAGYPNDFYVVDTATSNSRLPLVQTLPGRPYPNNVEVARDGRILCGIESYGPPDVWVYAPSGLELASYQVAYYGLITNQLKVSGDGLRMVTITSRGPDTPDALAFYTIAP